MAIILKRARPETADLNGHVHLDPEAELIVRRLSKQTGRPMRFVLSEIVLQAAQVTEVID